MEVLKNIFDKCAVNVLRYEAVHGGDINNAFCLYTSDRKYFLKLNDWDRFPAMFEKEANGLTLLHTHCPLVVPKVIRTGEFAKQQFLLLEWLESGIPQKDMWEHFGAGLATMHKNFNTHFGLREDNFIGSLKQINTLHSEWDIFYTTCRIMPLVKTLFDSGSFSSGDITHANSFCKRLKDLFPAEPPALLHGDLWSGNYLITSAGRVALYDPAVYFGHREMDIGMTKLFGGFDSRFYGAYNSVYPLQKGWEKRLEVTQLYPLLVHAVLFGGHYTGRAREILKA